jgi:hypothetical protein
MARSVFAILIGQVLILIVVQVPGVVSTSQLPILLASVQEELDNSEWAVRKAAADTLACMATAASGALASHKGGVVAALENSRFDKVSVFCPDCVNFQDVCEPSSIFCCGYYSKSRLDLLVLVSQFNVQNDMLKF